MGFNKHIAAAIELLGLSVSVPSAITFLGISMPAPSVKVTEPALEMTEGRTQAQVHLLPISMSQAVEAAEAVVPGQAISAQLEVVEDRPVYEIQMVGIDRSLSTVEVDGEHGEVAVVPDREDQGQTEEDQRPTDRLSRPGEEHSI